MEKLKVALIGSGMISEVYLKNLQSFDAIELVGCSDIVPERAKARAEQFSIKAMTNEEIFADPEIKLVVNTTYPLAHYEVAKQALLAGKHVYTEKMVTETIEQENELIALAQKNKLFLGGAPDTFLGGSAQLARSIVDSGILGKLTMVEAFLSRSYHHERFYKGEEKRFAFCRHGGIIFDMGSYYLTQMVFLLGGINRVSGFAQIVDKQRKYMNPNCKMYGQDMTVESWNNITACVEFKCGALGTLTTTSEGGAGENRFVLHGTNGSIDLGDPNEYEDHIVMTNKGGEKSVIKTPFAFHGENFRGLGVADAVYAIKSGRTPRCSAELNRHVLEAALGIIESSQTGKTYCMATGCERPEPFKAGYTEYPELVLNI